MKQLTITPTNSLHREKLTKSTNDHPTQLKQIKISQPSRRNIYTKSSLNKTRQQDQTNYLPVQQQAQRIVNNKLKGNKLYIAQYRQKQLLKNQSISHANAAKVFLQNVLIDDYVGMQQSIGMIGGSSIPDGQLQFIERNRISRPKTGGFFSADSTIKKRKKIRENTQQYKNNTIMLVNNIHPKPLVYDCSYFRSQNLDMKMNDYMNYFIKNQGRSTQQSQRIINQIQTEGMLPHSRRLTNFQRKMKMRKKVKSMSNQKMQNNGLSLSINKINKTIQAIKSTPQSVSPLIVQLEMKKIFNSYIINNNSIRGSHCLKENKR